MDAAGDFSTAADNPHRDVSLALDEGEEAFRTSGLAFAFGSPVRGAAESDFSKVPYGLSAGPTPPAPSPVGPLRGLVEIKGLTELARTESTKSSAFHSAAQSAAPTPPTHGAILLDSNSLKSRSSSLGDTARSMRVAGGLDEGIPETNGREPRLDTMHLGESEQQLSGSTLSASKMSKQKEDGPFTPPPSRTGREGAMTEAEASSDGNPPLSSLQANGKHLEERNGESSPLADVLDLTRTSSSEDVVQASGMKEMASDLGLNGRSLGEEVRELRAQLGQIAEERDVLEDLLLQEQLKNKTPQSAQLEEAVSRAAALEVELQAMAKRCEEWRQRAGQKAVEMNPALVQALLEEHLEDVDESGVMALKAEVARLREELVKSEVLRFELFKQVREAEKEAPGSQWEEEEEGLLQQIEETGAGMEDTEKGSEGAAVRAALALSSNKGQRGERDGGGDDSTGGMQELVELGEASLERGQSAKSPKMDECTPTSNWTTGGGSESISGNHECDSSSKKPFLGSAGCRALDFDSEAVSLCAQGSSEKELERMEGAVRAAVARAEQAERESAERETKIRLLEAQLANLSGHELRNGVLAFDESQRDKKGADVSDLLKQVKGQNRFTHLLLLGIVAGPLVSGLQQLHKNLFQRRPRKGKGGFSSRPQPTSPRVLPVTEKPSISFPGLPRSALKGSVGPFSKN